ncbi:DUF636 domain protein [Atractiella rhizophila]|nr:DUF636 domain protein [Atractiella rhizophila]
MGYSGYCACKAVTYTIDADAPVFVGHDHCDRCQRTTGSSFSAVIVVPRAAYKVSGPVKDWVAVADSGKDVHYTFCATCGSQLAHAPDSLPNVIAVKLGTLHPDQKKVLKPDTDIWRHGS